MNIIIVTGAAGGIGKEFVRQLKNEKGIDEIWVIGRTEAKLQALKDEFGDKIVPYAVDVTDDASMMAFQDVLKEKNPTVKWLINCAGTRALYKPGADLPRFLATIRTNGVGNIAMCYICIPYLKKGSILLNVSSAASFQPLPFNNTYAASKVALRFYTKGLERELKGKGIKITCCCPGWVDTELMKFKPDEVTPIIKLPGVTTGPHVAKKAIKDARKGKSISFPTLKVHRDYYLTKFLPGKVVLWYAEHIECDNVPAVDGKGIYT
ncbi:MAG: SDR family NAD(P)-dependent oxidoreductase [Clostridia bacterium]|jgi:Short-chain dehydrogenases of various substrate specificities|nr:SDR family NAD(P)-dependent oxidoreductase [Oscillospiraceae bacterium]MBO7681788.1 SDR family NAD(P)-dependent oxidoreductase [Clostridia bacterium]MDO4406102.1 SDR family NAD(P)-dependent oxidoreductase [Eubacteriales bacterium]MBQ1596875.1 SDR family NAD(P)-dependent oxidoreductase [Clostridia bacterium]MBQ1664026.1 SDR family NAD(P)-dependent oxidoreductase [Clostridia bacterium]